MAAKNTKQPLGLIIIKNLYALISVGYGAIIVFPAIHKEDYINIAVWGTEITGIYSVLINSVMVILPLILYLGFSRPTITTWYLALLYHVFFIGNSLLGSLSVLLEGSVIQPIIKISGLTSFTDLTLQRISLPSSFSLFIGFNITLLLGIFILFYLWQQKELFMPKKLIEKI